MRRLLEWWSDLTSVLTDPEVLMVLTLAGGALAIVALAVYSIWRWRVEKAFIEMEIRDVLARADHYATAIPPTDASGSGIRRRDYLEQAVERWIRLQYELWTDFQVYLAFRTTRGIRPETSRCARQLAAGFREMLTGLWGKPEKALASAVINNALATAFGMRPSPPPRVSIPEEPGQTAPPADIDDLLTEYDPWGMEEAALAELEKSGPAWLHRLLRVLEWQNAHSRLSGRVDGANPLVLEMVLWIVHEEKVGPVPLSGELLDIFEVGPQLLPHLPDFLRDGSIETVQRSGTRLTVRFRNVTLPRGTRFEGAVGLPVPLRADGKLWQSSRIEFDVMRGTAAVVFENR